MIRNPLALTSRSSRIDALHYGSIAVVDAGGRLLFSANDPAFPTYLRSSIKMIQSLPVVLSGAAEQFGLTAKELAITVASHAATREHVETVEGMLAKIDLGEANLGCGAHEPEDRSERNRLIRADEAPSQLHNNCSGKHAGMLAVCRAQGWPVESYLDIEHPLQQWILDLMAEYSGIAREQIGIGIDGCSLPAFYMPISGAARIAARFIERSVEGPSSPDAQVRRAIASYPEMINAPGGFDTELIRVTGGRIIAKRGAMAIFLLGVESSEYGPIGIAVKLEDGVMTPMPTVVMQTLEALNLLTPEELVALDPFRSIVQRNWRGIEVGAITAGVKLSRSEEREARSEEMA